MHPLSRLILSFLHVCALLPLQAQDADRNTPFTVAASPDHGLISVIHGGEPYLDFGYYAWDVNWGGVHTTQRATASEKKSSFSYEHTLPSSQTAFGIQGSWTQTDTNTFTFEALLTPEATAPLTMAQFNFQPGAAFIPGTADILLADGSSSTTKVPFGVGSIGENIQSLTLTDLDGHITTFRFDPPADLAMHTQARMVIAQKTMTAGTGYPLAFTLTLPASARFYPGIADLPPSTPGWYEFKGESPIPANSEWSLASWLETPAGKHGRITRKEDQLLYNQKAIKLWGINNSFAACAPDNALADRRADFYAAMGINSVRLHKYADGHGWAGILTKDSAVTYDPVKLDEMDYYIAALKKRGIYTKLSPVFMIDIAEGDRAAIPYMDELGTMRNDRINPGHGSLYVSTELQDLLARQMRNLLKHKNPYTGLTYAEDPAIAFIELYNEDSALFGGVSVVLARSPTLRARIGADFAAWLRNKYSTEEAFLEAWGENTLNCSIVSNQKLPLDENWAENRIYPAGNPWFFDPENLNGSQRPFRRRLLDTMAYLYELQNEVYRGYTDIIRDAGYTGEILSSNWQAGRMMSHFYNLHSDAMIGTIDRHNYFGGGRISFPFNNGSMLAIPGGGMLSSSLQQVDNRPFMLSEWIHVAPNEWGVEGPAILGAYGMGLQGWDVSYPFQNRDAGTFSTSIGSQPWDAAAPNFLGIFPAVSRQVLRGDVKESTVTHYRNVHVPSLDSGQVGFDETVTQQWDIKSFESDVFPSSALAAAKSVVRFTETVEATETFDLAAYQQKGDILSSTRELRWHPGESNKDGYIVINTPGTQAVIGFAQDQHIDLAESSILSDSRYAAIYLSARSPEGTLADDNAILVSAIARARNENAAILEDQYVYSRGTMKGGRPTGPVRMEPVKARITLKRPGNPTVYLLDHNGVKTGKTLPVKNGVFEIDTGRDQTPYYLIELQQSASTKI